MGRQLGRCKKCNCQATIEERDNGVCIWCSARKLENEDISWLLNEISALRDELARVKAESLRVVKDGDMREAYRCDKVLHDGRYCVVGTRILDDYFPIQISDAITGKYVDKVTCQALVQPVRLERWEDE